MHMQDYLYIEINVIALIIIFLILSNMRHRLDWNLLSNRIFLSLMLLTTAILVFDIMTRILNGRSSPFARSTLSIATFIYFLIEPVICLTLSLYVDYQINRSIDRIKNIILPMAFPVMINAVLTILNLFGRYYYYIDSHNVYHRGVFFFLMPVLSGIYIIYAAVYVLCARKRIHVTYIFSYVSLILPPLVGTVIQMMSPSISFIWIGMALSQLVIFMNIQNEQMHKDYLTGLFNRRQLDFYLDSLPQKRNVHIAGIMLDLNSFKHINDHFGHYTGDEALRHTSVLLQKTFGKNAFLSRFGGDEFVIFFEVSDRSEMEKAIQELRVNVKLFNKTKALPYKIDFSIGADLYPCDSMLNGQDFLNYIDTLMYQDKHTLLQNKFSPEQINAPIT